MAFSSNVWPFLQQKKSSLFANNLFKSIPSKAGNKVNIANELKAKTKAAWKLKALKAGMGIMAPAPKAAINERSLQRT